MDLPISEILLSVTESKDLELTPEEMETLVIRLTSPDDIPQAEESKVQAIPFDKKWITKSNTEFTLGNITTNYRELQFHDTLRIAQVIPQAVIYLFGSGIETLQEKVDPVEIAYTVFFKSLTDGITGQLTEFTEAVLELFCMLISNDEYMFEINDIIYAKGVEPIKVFRGLVSVNADFFAELPRSLPASMTRGITSLGGTITSVIAPMINLWNMTKGVSIPTTPPENSAGGITNGLSISTNPPSSKKGTRSKKSKQPV